MLDNYKIGNRIALLRKEKGLSGEKFAEALSVSPQAVSKWENGKCLPETALLPAVANLLGVSIDEILLLDTPKNAVSAFINRNYSVPDEYILDWVPRISRWSPPEGCDMWYSFPAAIATALVCVEAKEQNRTAIPYTELNERFRDLMHITGMGYGFLWNMEKRHLIEELWHINNISEMVAQAMGYYGRDYLWLTPANATIDEARGIIMWSIAQGRPVVMEWPGGIPEFNVVTGYADSGETLIGFTYCEECAAKKNDYGMFVNPARWGEPWGNGNGFRILIIGDKVKPTVSDSDTIQYALNVLNKNEADDKEFFLTHEFIAGDAAFSSWLEACDNTGNTVSLFTQTDMYSYALYMNTIYAQSCILPYYKKHGALNNRRVNDIAIKIDIALSRITNERKQLDEAKERGDNFAAMCREHIKNLKNHREYMRGWLRELLSEISKQKKKPSETSKPDKKKNNPRHALLNKVIPTLIYNENKDKGFVQGFHYDDDTEEGTFFRKNCQSILKAVAQWHTAFWENHDAFSRVGLDWRFETKENLLSHISMMEKDFKNYRKNEESGKIPKVWEDEFGGTPFRFENHINPQQLDCFMDAIERLKNEYWYLVEARFHTGKNITVIHGNMHPGTVNISKSADKTVKFDGFQAVRMGLPTEDLAMLIALHIEPDKQKVQPLLDFYYRCLCEGVKDYSYETFMNDYKIDIMENMFFTIRLINRGIYDFMMRDKAIRAFETFVLEGRIS